MTYRRSVQDAGAWASMVAARVAVGITLTVAAVLATSSSALAISATCGSPVLTGDTSVVTCSYTGGVQVFQVPAGVYNALLNIVGYPLMRRLDARVYPVPRANW